MLYMALYPDRKDYRFNEQFLLKAHNRLLSLVPDAGQWEETVKVIESDDVAKERLLLSVDSIGQKAVGYFEEVIL
jgi:hypothetical protein